MSSVSGQENELSLFTIACFWIIYSIYWIILTPLSLYWAYRFYKLSKKNIAFINKRHPKFVIYMVLISNLYPCIIRPIADLLPLYSKFHESELIFLVFHNLEHITNLLFTIRIWLLYYDHTHSQQALAFKWKKFILKENEKSPWTIRYSWLGNVKILSIIATAIMIIYLSVIILGVFIAGRNAINYTQIVPFNTFIIAIIMTFKIKKCTNAFYIKKEYFVSCAFYTVLILFYFIITAIFPEPGMIERRLAMSVLGCIPTYIVSLMATHWTIKQYKKDEKAKAESKEEIVDHDKEWSLEKVLSTEEGFTAFANHLVETLTIENLLFIFEMVLIKHDLLTQNVIKEEDIGVVIPIETVWRFGASDDAKAFNIDNLRQDLDRIMQQYICRGSELCINIRSWTREKMIRQWKRLQNNEEWDEALHERQFSESRLNHMKSLPTTDLHSSVASLSNDEMSPRAFGEEEEKESVNDVVHGSKSIDKVERDTVIVKYYMRIFDKAMKEIIRLLKKDPLNTFYEKVEYRILIREKSSYNMSL